jgi:hypothetical protein
MYCIPLVVQKVLKKKEKEEVLRLLYHPRLLPNASTSGEWERSRIKSVSTLLHNHLIKLILYETVSLRYSFFMGVWKQIAEYLYIKKPDPDRPKTRFVKYMHGINRISLFLFIIALIILAFKLILKK